MDVFPRTSEDSNIDKDSLSEGSLSHDSLVNENNSSLPHESVRLRRQGSYTIEISPQMSQSIEAKMSSDVDTKAVKNKVQNNTMTQSMYERPWITSKRNNSILSAINKQREEKLRLAKEDQKRKQKQKIVGLNETQRQSEIARKRKEEEMHRKLQEKKAKELERHRIVEERKLRLAQAEEARKSRILRKMTNQEERQSVPHPPINMMTMSCYGAVGDTKRRPGNKEVVKNRFISKRPLSSTGKVIGFGSSSPRIICENPMKSIPKHPPKISDYLMERSQILSRPNSSRVSNRMTTSSYITVPSPPVIQTRPVVRQSSLKEKRPLSAMTSSMMDNAVKTKSIKKLKPLSIKTDSPDGRISNTSQQSRNSSRQSNSLHPSQANDFHRKSSQERPSPVRPVHHSNGPLDKSIIQSKSSTFPKTKKVSLSKKCKVDVHLDSDSIEEEGTTLTESFNKPRSITSSSVSHMKNEVNRTDLSSADSLESEKIKPLATDNSDNVQSTEADNSSSKNYVTSRGLPTKDLTEADYKARLMENRRLIREKREKEREQLMKAERDRRHIEEATVRETIELEKANIMNSKEPHCTTSNDDGVEEQAKPVEIEEPVQNEVESHISILVDADESKQSTETNKELESEEKERLDRKKRLELIMSRLKKTNEESSSEGGGISPRRAMSPELAEIDTEVPVASGNPTFRSTLLQSMLNKGKLSGITKTPSPISNKDSEESQIVEHNPPMGTLALTSLRESMEDSESLQNNVNSKSSVAVRSSGIDGNSLSDANSDFVVDLEDSSHSSVTSNVLHKADRGNCDGQEELDSAINENKIINDVKANGAKANKYSSASSIETEEEEIIKNSFNKDHLYNSHIIRPLAQEGYVFQS